MPAPDGSSNGSVSYTTKELLTRIENKIDTLDSKLDHKADQSAVDALIVQIEVLRETAVRREGPLMKEYWDYTHETRSRIEAVERDTQRHEQYVEPFITVTKDVNDLKTWRTRMVAIMAVIAPVATVTAGIVVSHLIK